MMRLLSLVLLLGGCVGDSTSGSDAGADASNDTTSADVQGDVGTTDAGTDASDAAACPPATMSLTANCASPKVACLRQSQTTCESPGNCSYISGGRQLLCGSNGDCDGGAVCCASKVTLTAGCPTVVAINGNVTNFATQCSTSTSKTCASGDVQVCLATAECATGTCQGAVFDVNGNEVVKFGVCQ